ncbi:Hypothetical predicted protein [Podarcis lilfordi]|uniref:Uncharacterized protein n=1 Tax=Podarcis lilfordi TaxID=74358 RepID=A0AA35NZL9_9SAUR|nr:Hypothetical predicted protein [Podarcis lilfordi]
MAGGARSRFGWVAAKRRRKRRRRESPHGASSGRREAVGAARSPHNRDSGGGLFNGAIRGHAPTRPACGELGSRSRRPREPTAAAPVQPAWLGALSRSEREEGESPSRPTRSGGRGSVLAEEGNGGRSRLPSPQLFAAARAPREVPLPSLPPPPPLHRPSSLPAQHPVTASPTNTYPLVPMGARLPRPRPPPLPLEEKGPAPTLLFLHWYGCASERHLSEDIGGRAPAPSSTNNSVAGVFLPRYWLARTPVTVALGAARLCLHIGG